MPTIGLVKSPLGAGKMSYTFYTAYTSSQKVCQNVSKRVKIWSYSYALYSVLCIVSKKCPDQGLRSQRMAVPLQPGPESDFRILRG